MAADCLITRLIFSFIFPIITMQREASSLYCHRKEEQAAGDDASVAGASWGSAPPGCLALLEQLQGPLDRSCLQQTGKHPHFRPHDTPQQGAAPFSPPYPEGVPDPSPLCVPGWSWARDGRDATEKPGSGAPLPLSPIRA